MERQPDFVSYTDRPDDEVDVVVKNPEIQPVKNSEYDANEIDSDEMEDCILCAVEVGEEVSVKHLIEVLEGCCEEGEVLCPQDVIDCVKGLVAKGNFEVVKRDPYNGRPYMILRVS